jgi:hypothetical protein
MVSFFAIASQTGYLPATSSDHTAPVDTGWAFETARPEAQGRILAASLVVASSAATAVLVAVIVERARARSVSGT